WLCILSPRALLSTLFPYTTLFRSVTGGAVGAAILQGIKRGLFSNEAGMGSAPNAAATAAAPHPVKQGLIQSLGAEPIPASFENKDRKSTRLNSSHVSISYAVFCLK